MAANLDDDRSEEQVADLSEPSFVAHREGIMDGWSYDQVARSDDFELDSLLGEIFADQAVQYARKIKNPAFIFFVMASILRKTADHRLTPGGLEHGFLTRIGKLAYLGALN